MIRFAAILFSVLLLGQPLLLPAWSPAEPEVCRCCDCGRTECCLSETPAAPDSQPAVPASARGQSQEHSLPPTTLVSWSQLHDSTVTISLRALPLRAALGTPLYERLCVLLI